MRNLIVPIAIGLLCTSFAITHPGKVISRPTHPSVHWLEKDSLANVPSQLYSSLHLQSLGLSKEAFDYAMQGYQNLIDQNKIARQQYLTICDFSQASSQKRLYIINLTDNKIVFNTYVAHGRNSGEVYANSFSNTPESLQSSLGFYATSNTYLGAHGLSLRLNGLESGINDNALERGIVIHGADYVDAARAKNGVFMGRSYGCPAVPQKESAAIINTIKNGTCLFIYHPTNKYLQISKILND